MKPTNPLTYYKPYNPVYNHPLMFKHVYCLPYICFLYSMGCYDPDTDTLYAYRFHDNNKRILLDFYVSLPVNMFKKSKHLLYESIKDLIDLNVYALPGISEDYQKILKTLLKNGLLPIL